MEAADTPPSADPAQPRVPSRTLNPADTAAGRKLHDSATFLSRALDDSITLSYAMHSRRDQRGAALSPRSARLPGGSPRGFRPRVSEPVPSVGPREPASAITGQRLHGSSLIACGSFFCFHAPPPNHPYGILIFSPMAREDPLPGRTLGFEKSPSPCLKPSRWILRPGTKRFRFELGPSQ